MKQTDDRAHAKRDGRMTAVIVHEAAKFIEREATSESLITALSARVWSHGDRVTVYVSVFPDDKARAALAFLDRQRKAFSDYLKEHTRIAPLPRIDFALAPDPLS